MAAQLEKKNSTTHERYAWQARFILRLNRLKNLLTTKWWIPLTGITAALAIECALWSNEKPVYSSYGQMIVSVKLSIPEGSVYTEELNNFIGTQAALMQSGVVINHARARVAATLPDLPMQSIPLKVTVLPKTTIFLLQGTGGEPRYTQAFVQACMDEYVNLKKDMRTQMSDVTIAGLTEELLRLKKELLRCDEEMVAFQSTNSVVLLPEQDNTAGSYLAALDQRFAAMKSEYCLLETLTLDQNLEWQQQGIPLMRLSADSKDWPSQNGADQINSDYARAKQQILLLKADQQDFAQYLRPKHPKMIALNEEIARCDRLLNIFLQQSGERLEIRKNSLKLQINHMEKDVQEWGAKTLEIGRQTAEFHRLKTNAQRVQALYDRLLATMQTLDLNKEISPESVNIMEKASMPFPHRSNLLEKLLFGGLVGLGCSLLVLVGLNQLDDRINSFSELSDLFDEDVLGQIPREASLNSANRIVLIQPGDKRHALFEAYRSLRSSLLYSFDPEKLPQTILVTSSVPGEGKSITAANLAITLAIGGSRVLLIDGDLRKGSQHSRFDLDAGAGLSEVLSAERIWTELVRETTIPKLFLLSRGMNTQSSSELFLTGSIDTLLEAAAAQYDFVIVDTAPVMAADDVTSLAPSLDGALFVLRAEHTSARVAHAALESLYQRRVRILGLVFNAIRPSNLDYYFKYKDYYTPAGPPANKWRASNRL
jgi:capsular exopolysaccharide synthesis family protein